MKKLSYAFLFIVALVLGGVVLLPKLLPLDTVKQEAEAKVRELTGREFSIAGPVDLKFWPNIAIELNDVKLGNPSWATEKTMVALGRARVELALMPLLERRIEVRQFTLQSPVIHLEKNKDGKGSWEMMPASSAGAAASGAAGNDSASAPLDIRLGVFEIRDGTLSFIDHAGGTTEKLSDVDVTIALPSLDGALKVDGDFDFRGDRMTLMLALDALKPVLDGKGSRAKLTLSSDKMSLHYDGDLSAAAPYLKGEMKFDAPQLGAFAAWAAQDPAAGQGLPFSKATIGGKVELDASRLSVLSAEILADDLKARGDMNVNFSGKPVVVSARLGTGRLVVDRFMKPETGEAAAKNPAPAVPDQGWSREPIDFSGLKSVNADLTLEVEGVTCKGIDTGPATVSVALKNGYLNLGLSETSVLKGTFKGALVLDSSGVVPEVAAQFQIKGVEIKPVLEAFAGFKKLSGTGDVEANLHMRGRSQFDLVSSLSGPGSVVFRNGALEGIDLANIAQMVQKGLANMNIGEGKTEFVEMGGTFNAANGIVSNQDFAMKGPLVRATGKGTADLPKKYLQYRVEPVLTASSAVEGATGVGIPVDIVGPFSALKIRPDFKSVINNALENPEAVKEQIKAIGENADQAKDAIKGLLQGLGR